MLLDTFRRVEYFMTRGRGRTRGKGAGAIQLDVIKRREIATENGKNRVKKREGCAVEGFPREGCPS